jgi:hypothetical protein
MAKLAIVATAEIAPGRMDEVLPILDGASGTVLEERVRDFAI